MNTFQQKFPLSPRKFWKKILTPVPVTGGVLISNILSLTILFLILIEVLSDVPSGLLVKLPVMFYLVIGAPILGALLYALLKAWYVSEYIRRYFYEVSDDVITIRKGVFAPQEIHVLWNKVQDVYVDQDVLDRLLGIYDVHLASATYASGVEAHIDGVNADVADGLKKFFLVRVQTTTTISATVSAIAPAMNTPPINGISSIEYPIDGRWLILQIFASLGLGLFWVVIFGFVFLIPDMNTTLSVLTAQHVPLTATSLFWFLLSVYLVFAVCGFVWQVIWRANFFFELGTDYVVKRGGVISRFEKHMPYQTMQDVIVSQGVLERFLGIAHVIIQNAAQGIGGSTVLPGQPLGKANELSAKLRKIVLSRNSSRTGV